MSFRNSLRLAVCQMVAAGFLPLFLTGRVGWLVGLLFLAGIAWTAFSRKAFQPPVRPESNLRAFLGALALLIFYGLDVAVLGSDFVVALAHVAMPVILLKMARPRRPRDLLYVTFLSLGFLLLSTLYTFDMTFLFFSLWYFVSGALALMLLGIRASERAFGTDPGPAATVTETAFRLPTRRLFWLGVRVSLSVLLIAVPIFLSLPRLAFGLFRWDALSAGTSGFNETTRLGDVSSIRLSETVAMRVLTDEAPDRLPADLKWRGVALDRFDGRSWSSSRRPSAVSYVRPGQLHMVANRRPRERLLRQEFFLEPTASPSLFMAPRPYAVSWEVGPVVYNSDVVRTVRVHLEKFRYTAISDIRRPTAEELNAAPPVEPGKFYLKSTLELGPFSFRIADLVARLTAGCPTPYAKALALERYLKNNYPYSLEMAVCPPGKLPIEFFLFEMRRGHCEYFASAMAIMLRYAGIPSKLVNGYQAGEVNPLNGSFVVRQSDAHSWVEAWFQGIGWVSFDPTPASAVRRHGGALGFLDSLLEYIHFLWLSQVVNFDITDQVQVFTSVRETVRDTVAWLRSAWKSLEGSLSSVWKALSEFGTGAGSQLAPSSLWLPVLALAAALAAWALCRRVRRTWSADRGDPRLRAARDRLGRAAGKAGLVRRDGETMREFLARLEGVCASPAIEVLADSFHRLRYGGAGERVPERYAALAESVGQVCDALKQSRKNAVRGA